MVDLWLARHASVLFEFNVQRRITRINESDPETAAPLVFVALGFTSNLALFRDDVPEQIALEITAELGTLPAWNGTRTDPAAFDPIRSIVENWRQDIEESHGPAFRFEVITDASVETVLIDASNDHLLAANFPYTRSVLAERSPVVGVVRNGAVVSACYSARSNDEAAEAGVDTIAEYRGQGFAVSVVEDWARATVAAGLVPLYSTSWQNQSSLSVAKKLDLEVYADTWSISVKDSD